MNATKIPTLSEASNSDEQASALRNLARIIARVHLHKSMTSADKLSKISEVTFSSEPDTENQPGNEE